MAAEGLQMHLLNPPIGTQFDLPPLTMLGSAEFTSNHLIPREVPLVTLKALQLGFLWKAAVRPWRSAIESRRVSPAAPDMAMSSRRIRWPMPPSMHSSRRRSGGAWFLVNLYRYIAMKVPNPYADAYYSPDPVTPLVGHGCNYTNQGSSKGIRYGNAGYGYAREHADVIYGQVDGRHSSYGVNGADYQDGYGRSRAQMATVTVTGKGVMSYGANSVGHYGAIRGSLSLQIKGSGASKCGMYLRAKDMMGSRSLWEAEVGLGEDD